MIWAIRLRRVLIGIFGVFLAIPLGAETATIHLLDGSKLRGEVISLKGGAYTIATESAGTLSINESQIEVVEYGGGSPAAAKAPQPSSLDPGLIQGMQARLLKDPNIMSLIESLQSDPDVQALITDPEIKAAIASGDFLSLLNNPKFMQFMQNPKVRSITQAAK